MFISGHYLFTGPLRNFLHSLFPGWSRAGGGDSIPWGDAFSSWSLLPQPPLFSCSYGPHQSVSGGGISRVPGADWCPLPLLLVSTKTAGSFSPTVLRVCSQGVSFVLSLVGQALKP